MKRIVLALLFAAWLCPGLYAQRFRAGLRAGGNIMDYSMPAVVFDDGTFRKGDVKAGFEAALVVRLGITKHLHLQTEFAYNRANYDFDYLDNRTGRRSVTINANRMEVPVELGLNFGGLRLFGGAVFRIAHSERSSNTALLKVGFNDSDVGFTAGAGFLYKSFFVEGRVSGYFTPHTRNRFTSLGETQTVNFGRHLRWSLSTGILF